VRKNAKWIKRSLLITSMRDDTKPILIQNWNYVAVLSAFTNSDQFTEFTRGR